jgi:hypothetical protein
MRAIRRHDGEWCVCLSSQQRDSGLEPATQCAFELLIELARAISRDAERIA